MVGMLEKMAEVLAERADSPTTYFEESWSDAKEKTRDQGPRKPDLLGQEEPARTTMGARTLQACLAHSRRTAARSRGDCPR